MQDVFDLDWHIQTGPDDPHYFCEGTELENAMCGNSNRFMICVVRALDGNGLPTVQFHVRDAETVRLEDIILGRRSKVVAKFQFLDSALDFVEEQSKFE